MKVPGLFCQHPSTRQLLHTCYLTPVSTLTPAPAVKPYQGFVVIYDTNKFAKKKKKVMCKKKKFTLIDILI